MKLLRAESAFAERKRRSQETTEKFLGGKQYGAGKRGSDSSKKPDEGKSANFKDSIQK